MDLSLNDDAGDEITASINRISISGVQEKISAVIKKTKPAFSETMLTEYESIRQQMEGKKSKNTHPRIGFN